jgi:hypothetical protein
MEDLKMKIDGCIFEKTCLSLLGFFKNKYMFLGKIILVNYVIVGIVLPLKSGFEITFNSFCKENMLRVSTKLINLK